MLRVHWLAITFFMDYALFREYYWNEYFSDIFGELVEQGHGGRGYAQIAKGLTEVKVYHDPNELGKNGVHCHLEIPGDACDSITPDRFIDLFRWLKNQGIKCHVTRLDFAFDDCPFSPEDVLQAVKDEKLVSLVKRESVNIMMSPWELRDDGQLGCSTLYIGARESQRMVRVYNKRGYTRLEMVCKDERAQVVAFDLLTSDYDQWDVVGLGHLRQFIEFSEVEWWITFIGGSERYDVKISAPRTAELMKMSMWFMKQVSVAYYVMHNISDGEYTDILLKQGEQKYRNAQRRGATRYDAIMQLAG